MKQNVRVLIYPDDGGFVVECDDLAATTQGDTIEEALANMREVLSLALDDADLSELGIAPNPSVIVTIELGALADAG